MRERLRNISLILFVALYFVAANGMVLESAARLYSTADAPAIAFHNGGARGFPVPSLVQRTYTPLTAPVVVLSSGYVVSTIVYPVQQAPLLLWLDEALPSYTADLSATVSDRAPPAA